MNIVTMFLRINSSYHSSVQLIHLRNQNIWLQNAMVIWKTLIKNEMSFDLTETFETLCRFILLWHHIRTKSYHNKINLHIAQCLIDLNVSVSVIAPLLYECYDFVTMLLFWWCCFITFCNDKNFFNVSQIDYKKQKKETIDNYRGFQTMDSKHHPVVQQGIKAAAITSNVSWFHSFIT